MPPAGVAPVLVPAGGFGIDGNLLANRIFTNAGDWMAGPGGTGGSVLDATGAVVANANVTVTNRETKVSSVWLSNQVGEYTAPFLVSRRVPGGR